MATPVEQIKERLDIVEVLGSYIKLQKAGQNYKAKCPFHNEKTPSFSVSPSRQSFYCFGCQAGGDIFSFIERIEGTDFKGALTTLADRAGVKLKEFKPEEEETLDILHRIMEKSALFFENNLKKSPEAQEYLRGRGIEEKGVEKWRIGLANDAWRDLHDFLLKEGYSREEMLLAGVIKKAPQKDRESEKFYDTFRNRIMFPIFDASGRVIAFSGRSLTESPNAPKYLNSPETKLFKKSEVLYGLNFAKSSIRTADYSVLVEGQIDLVLSHEAGVANTVASSGTALTDLHLNRLKKISNRVILAYDGDNAGEKAARRSLELALSLGMEVKIARLKEGEDPASIAKDKPEEWKDILRKAEDGISFFLHKVVKEGLKGVSLAKKINSEILPLVLLLQNEMVKSQYAAQIAKETGIAEAAINAELVKQKSGQAVASQERVKEDYRSFLSTEEMLAGFILWQASEKDGKDHKEITEKARSRFVELLGETIFSEIVDNGNIDKEALIFETERIFNSGDFQGGIEAAVNELFLRVEKSTLKIRFESLAVTLDKEQDTAKKAEIEKEMREISKKLSVLSV